MQSAGTERDLVTGDPANPVKIACQVRATPVADPARDKACVVVVAISAAVTGVVNRIARLERPTPDTKTASASYGDDQARLRRIKGYRPRREWIKKQHSHDRCQ